MEKFLKKAGWTSIITSLVLAFIGLVMIYNPQTTMQFISTVLGIFFIVLGVIKLINYFVMKGNSSLFNNDIALGIISILIGLVVIVYSSTIENIFRIMIGIWIIYSGFTRLTLSFKLKNVNEKIWAFVLLLSILMIWIRDLPLMRLHVKKLAISSRPHILQVVILNSITFQRIKVQGC